MTTRKSTRTDCSSRNNSRAARSTASTPSAQLSALFSQFPAEIIALAKQCLSRLRKALPGINLLVYEYADSRVVSFSMSEHGYEGIVTLKVLPQEVRLYFDKSILDPKRLLQGSGGKVRSVMIKAASDLDRGDIHALLKAAINHSGVTLTRTGSNRVILKSLLTKSKKKKKKK